MCINGDLDTNLHIDIHMDIDRDRDMNIDNFVTFLGFFVQAGHDLNATNPEGQTLAQIAHQHGHGADYVNALNAAATSATH